MTRRNEEALALGGEMPVGIEHRRGLEDSSGGDRDVPEYPGRLRLVDQREGGDWTRFHAIAGRFQYALDMDRISAR